MMNIEVKRILCLVAVFFSSAGNLLAKEMNDSTDIDKGAFSQSQSFGCIQQYPVTDPRWQGFEVSQFKQHLSATPFETAGVAVSTLALGLMDWDWGSSSFGTSSEGFFGDDTANGGMDKLGHVYGAYLLSELFTDAIHCRAANSVGAEASAVTLAWLSMLFVELGDGYSEKHGFAWEDIVANTAGVGLSYLRRNIPGLRGKLDFRLEYLPSGNRSGFKPHSDYSGQKYLLALKLSGFDLSPRNPLNYLELHGGYFARGFTLKEQEKNEPLRRELYFGVGLNIGELFFGRAGIRETTGGRLGRKFFEYVQIPHTYVANEGD
ncbi:DUF2279 domain-containing protein [Microbulbifer sp. THAF38]|uniref:DUF2279 domain-containing protein n=1 Tax=Microbulbifer sp. THAF38 TaxID=2587856 RepID=UPI001269333E|nr:DUF2279 domain-containing protein [Microbulbifer sp. THAF38]QFT54268.1 hypothetical protein FIU95_06805 [Microbulbifer sp. THAF38]